MMFYSLKPMLLTLLFLLLLGVKEGFSQSFSFGDTTISSNLTFSSIEIRGEVLFDSTSNFAPITGAKIQFYENGKLTIQGEIPNERLEELEITAGTQDCTNCEMLIESSDQASSLMFLNLFLHDIFRTVNDSLEINKGFLQLKNFDKVDFEGCVVEGIEVKDARIRNFDKHGAIRIDSCNSIQIKNSSFLSNRSSRRGGALSFFFCDTIGVENCDFIANIAIDTIINGNTRGIGGEGSALYTQGTEYIAVNSCLIANGLGTTGAIYIQSPSAKIKNSIIANNDEASIIFVAAGADRVVQNCTIINNSRFPLTLVGDAEIRNCFVLNNRNLRQPGNTSSEEDVFLFTNAQVTYINSVFFDGCRGCPFSDPVDTSGILAGPIPIDAIYSGGVNLPDFNPSPNSYLIDRGVLVGVSRTDVDFFGNPRWFGDAPDIGAVEFQGVSSTSREPSNQIDLMVFPNPTSGILHISSSEQINEIHIFDITGKTVLSQMTTDIGIQSLDLEVLRVGTYFIEVVTEKELRTSTKFLRLD